MIICIPSGVGDISWLVSKLINAPQWKEIEFEIADGWPFRAQPYLDMLGVKSSYGNHVYDEIIAFESMHPYKTWQDVVSKGFGKYFMQPNMHLEQGKPLADYLPDLDTNYHYPLEIPNIESKPYTRRLENLVNKWVGISAASYRGHVAWNTWQYSEWIKLLKMIIEDGYKICLIGGRWDDLTDELSNDLDEGEHLNIIGKTSFSQVCAVHEMLNYYIGFSSGLGIIRTVMELPTIMLWPEHQIKLSDSWADPEDLKSGRYIPSRYTVAEEVFELFKYQVQLTHDTKTP